MTNETPQNNSGQEPRYGQGQQPDYGAAPQYGQGQQPQYTSYATAAASTPAATYLQRPGTVLWGAILTFVGTGLGILSGLAMLFMGKSQGFLDTMKKEMDASGQQLPEGVTWDDLGSVLMLVGGVLLVWCLVALILAVMALRGSKGAAIALTVIGALWIVLALFGIAADPLSTLISVAWVGTACALLYLVRPSREWYSNKSKLH